MIRYADILTRLRAKKGPLPVAGVPSPAVAAVSAPAAPGGIPVEDRSPVGEFSIQTPMVPSEEKPSVERSPFPPRDKLAETVVLLGRGASAVEVVATGSRDDTAATDAALIYILDEESPEASFSAPPPDIGESASPVSAPEDSAPPPAETVPDGTPAAGAPSPAVAAVSAPAAPGGIPVEDRSPVGEFSIQTPTVPSEEKPSVERSPFPPRDKPAETAVLLGRGASAVEVVATGSRDDTAATDAALIHILDEESPEASFPAPPPDIGESASPVSVPEEPAPPPAETVPDGTSAAPESRRVILPDDTDVADLASADVRRLLEESPVTPPPSEPAAPAGKAAAPAEGGMTEEERAVLFSILEEKPAAGTAVPVDEGGEPDPTLEDGVFEDILRSEEMAAMEAASLTTSPAPSPETKPEMPLEPATPPPPVAAPAAPSAPAPEAVRPEPASAPSPAAETPASASESVSSRLILKELRAASRQFSLIPTFTQIGDFLHRPDVRHFFAASGIVILCVLLVVWVFFIIWLTTA
ncbi:MAG: hypothetical protein V1809_14935 [Planctomycetota bacterium]